LRDFRVVPLRRFRAPLHSTDQLINVSTFSTASSPASSPISPPSKPLGYLHSVGSGTFAKIITLQLAI